MRNEKRERKDKCELRVTRDWKAFDLMGDEPFGPNDPLEPNLSSCGACRPRSRFTLIKSGQGKLGLQ